MRQPFNMMYSSIKVFPTLLLSILKCDAFVFICIKLRLDQIFKANQRKALGPWFWFTQRVKTLRHSMLEVLDFRSGRGFKYVQIKLFPMVNVTTCIMVLSWKSCLDAAI